MPCDVDWDRVQLQYQHHPPAQQIIVDAPPSSLFLRGNICMNVRGNAYGFVDKAVAQLMARGNATRRKYRDPLVRALEEAILSGDLNMVHEVLAKLYDEHRDPETGWPSESVEPIIKVAESDLKAAGISLQYERTQYGIEVMLRWSDKVDNLLNVSSLRSNVWAQAYVTMREPKYITSVTDSFIAASELRTFAMKVLSGQQKVIAGFEPAPQTMETVCPKDRALPPEADFQPIDPEDIDLLRS